MSEHPASPAPHRLRQTRTARMARARLARHLQGFGSDRDLWWRVQDLVPEAWATVEEDIDCEEEKVKVTLRLDASVAKLFRAMGKGYQARINLILSSYAQMRIGEIDRWSRSWRNTGSFSPRRRDKPIYRSATLKGFWNRNRARR